MSYTIDTLVSCPNLQARLNQLFAIPDPADITVPSPLLQFLLSDANSNLLKQSVAPGDGKVRTVRAVYRQRRTGSRALVNQNNPTCTATNQATELYTDYTIDTTQNVQDNMKLNIATLATACTDNDMVLAEDIRDILNAIDERVAQKTAIESVALAGKWGTPVSNLAGVTVDGSDNLVLKTQISSSDVSVYPWSFQQVDTAARMTAYNQPMAIFGGSTFTNYAARVEKGCCANQGVDLGAMFQQYRKAVAYDYWVADAMGGEAYNLMLQSGALQMLYFNLFEGVNTILSPTFSRQVVVTKAGIPVDLMMKVDCGDLHIVATATTKTVGLPADMFPYGDLYRGVKWVNKLKVVNP